MNMHGKTNQRATLVSFSGIDGAGKSTQIEALCQRLQEIGLRVQLIRFWDDIARLKSIRESAGHALFKGDKGVGTPDAPITRKDKNVRSWGMTWIRMVLYFLDVLATRNAVHKALLTDADFIIFDRYCYDELANLNLRTRVLRIYTRMILKIIPVLNRSYLLDADPLAAHARKPEYPLDFVHLNRMAYLKMSCLSNRMTVIAPMGREEVGQAILRYTLEDLRHSTILGKNGGYSSKRMA
jgi:thymidylate kinase